MTTRPPGPACLKRRSSLRNILMAFVLPVLALVGLLFAPVAARAEDQRLLFDSAGGLVRLASLEWPPFSGVHLPGQGVSVDIARRAFAAVGLEMEVSFLPWKRAVEASQQGRFDGFFPVYFTESEKRDCAWSGSIGASPLGFVERRGEAVHWENLADLKSRTIGTVRGYLNTAQFDHMASSGELTVEEAQDDLTNMRKVAMGRIPMAVIDRYVFLSLRARLRHSHPEFQALQFNARPLEVKNQFLCFSNNDRGRTLARKFNEGLAIINEDKIIERWFGTYSLHTGM